MSTPIVFNVVKTPKDILHSIKNTNFEVLLEELRHTDDKELTHKIQTGTGHFYENFNFTWEKIKEYPLLDSVFNFVNNQYKKYNSPSKDIGLIPQLLHYPDTFGCLNTHTHNNLKQKVGVICVLYSKYLSGSFYVAIGNKIYLPAEKVGDTIIFNFELAHGVAIQSKNNESYNIKYEPTNDDVKKLGRVVAVLTSESINSV